MSRWRSVWSGDRVLLFRYATVVVMVALLTIGCVVGPAREGGDGALRPVRDLEFTACRAPELECATLAVPVDATDPDGPTFSLAVVRLPARDPQRRIGVLMVNPGGPGASGITLAASGLWPPEIRDRFDVVGVDVRGSGRSDPLRCQPTSRQLYDGDTDPWSPTAVAAAARVAAEHARSCAAVAGDRLAHLGSEDMARDLDRVRSALGEEQISSCRDQTWPRDLAMAASAAQTVAAESPHFPRFVLAVGLTCAAWPVPPAPPDTTWPDTAPQPVVVGTTGDPVSPYGNAAALAHSIPGARLVTVQGEGHGGYLDQRGLCIDTPITRYLLDRTLPPNLTCAPVPPR